MRSPSCGREAFATRYSSSIVQCATCVVGICPPRCRRSCHEYRYHRRRQHCRDCRRALGGFGARNTIWLAPSGATWTIVHGATAGTPEEAASFGEVVFCSVPYGAWPDLASALAPLLAGKVVLDSANPYPQRDGAFASDSLQLARVRVCRSPGSSLMPVWCVPSTPSTSRRWKPRRTAPATESAFLWQATIRKRRRSRLTSSATLGSRR